MAAQAIGEPLLDIRDLCVAYGATAVLRGLTATINRGETVAVMGRSGCGKTTLLLALQRHIAVQSGDISVGGEAILVGGEPVGPANEMLRRRVAMVGQRTALLPWLRCIDNIVLPMVAVCGLDRRAAMRQAAVTAERMGIAEVLARFPEEISEGQGQRVQLARAVLVHPEVLLLDEVTSGLDPSTLSEVLRAIMEVRDEFRERSQTLVIVTHLVDFAVAFADRVMLIADGKVSETGSAATLFAEPVSDEVATFLREANPRATNT